MAKLRELMEKKLFECGMFEDQAKAVMDSIEQKADADPQNTMYRRWSQDASGYPPTMPGVLYLTVKSDALKWIDANCPQAWFRPMFAG